MKNSRIYPLRLSDEDTSLLQAIQKNTGTTSQADVFRQALRVYAAKLKIKLTLK